MRLSLRALAFVFANLMLSIGSASAVTVMNDRAAITGAAHGERTVMPLGAPVQPLAYASDQRSPDDASALLTPTSNVSSATIASADVVAIDADADPGAGAGSNDPDGKVLGVWVWLLPISGIFCIAAYAFVNTLVNRSIAESAARRGVKSKGVGFFV